MNSEFDGVMGGLTILGFCALVVVLLAILIWHGHDAPFVPECQEDEIVVGIGDYDGDFWDDYQCVVFDDITYELGYADGYRDGIHHESFGGDH